MSVKIFHACCKKRNADLDQAIFSTTFFNFTPGTATEPERWTVSGSFLDVLGSLTSPDSVGDGFRNGLAPLCT